MQRALRGWIKGNHLYAWASRIKTDEKILEDDVVKYYFYLSFSKNNTHTRGSYFLSTVPELIYNIKGTAFFPNEENLPYWKLV